MARIPDRVKQRREFLKKRYGAYSLAALIGPAMILALLELLHHARAEMEFSRWRHQPLFADALSVHVALMVIVCLGFTGRLIHRIRQRADQLPYVPPVKADTLPADEVLIRSAAPPSTRADTLLRAASFDEKTSSAQLLRSNGQP